MDCKYTCFDRVMHLVIDFGVENGCFTKIQTNILYDGIVMWEDLDGNYYENDYSLEL